MIIIVFVANKVCIYSNDDDEAENERPQEIIIVDKCIYDEKA